MGNLDPFREAGNPLFNDNKLNAGGATIDVVWPVRAMILSESGNTMIPHSSSLMWTPPGWQGSVFVGCGD
jgi:hypothetical protein